MQLASEGSHGMTVLPEQRLQQSLDKYAGRLCAIIYLQP